MKTIKKATVRAFAIDSGQENLSGLKTVIGVVLILASGSLDTVRTLVLTLPDVPVLLQIQAALEFVIDLLQQASSLLGSGFLGFGLVDKVWKFIKALGT